MSWVSLECNKADQSTSRLPGYFFSKPRFLHFHAIMVDPVGGLRGLLGHFTSAQIDRIEELSPTAGESETWTSVINLLWAKLLLRVEVAWDGPEPSVATITVTPHFSLLSSSSASIPSVPLRYWHGIRSVAPAGLTQTAGALGSRRL